MEQELEEALSKQAVLQVQKYKRGKFIMQILAVKIAVYIESMLPRWITAMCRVLQRAARIVSLNEEKLCADDILEAIRFLKQYFMGELYTL